MPASCCRAPPGCHTTYADHEVGGARPGREAIGHWWRVPEQSSVRDQRECAVSASSSKTPGRVKSRVSTPRSSTANDSAPRPDRAGLHRRAPALPSSTRRPAADDRRHRVAGMTPPPTRRREQSAHLAMRPLPRPLAARRAVTTPCGRPPRRRVRPSRPAPARPSAPATAHRSRAARPRRQSAAQRGHQPWRGVRAAPLHPVRPRCGADRHRPQRPGRRSPVDQRRRMPHDGAWRDDDPAPRGVDPPAEVDVVADERPGRSSPPTASQVSRRTSIPAVPTASTSPTSSC